jgi:hypothetical protein
VGSTGADGGWRRRLVGEDHARRDTPCRREALDEPGLHERLDLAPAVSRTSGTWVARAPLEQRRHLGPQPVDHQLLVAQHAALAHREAQRETSGRGRFHSTRGTVT